MIFDWYKIFNLQDFLDLDLVSRTYTVSLEGIGQKDILVTKGNSVSVIYEDVLLPINFADKNPYVRDTFAVYKDDDDNVYVGVEVEE